MTIAEDLQAAAQKAVSMTRAEQISFMTHLTDLMDDAPETITREQQLLGLAIIRLRAVNA